MGSFTLECYPRLFGDPRGYSFVRAEWSGDGLNLYPLFEAVAKTDNKWEDVYGRRMETTVTTQGLAGPPADPAARSPVGTTQGRPPDAAPASSVGGAPGLTKLWLRFVLRQAQLVSQGNPPNQPMKLTLRPAVPLPGAPTLGQAVMLPARFAPKAHLPGVYRLRARLLTPDGPLWKDLGQHTLGQDEPAAIEVSGPAGSACDLLVLESLGRHATDSPAPPLAWRRENQARYRLEGPLPSPAGLLLFSESHHPRWLALGQGVSLAPLKAYGFQNAYPLGDAPLTGLRLEFAPQPVRERFLTVSLWVWAVLALVCAGACAGVLGPPFFSCLRPLPGPARKRLPAGQPGPPVLGRTAVDGHGPQRRRQPGPGRPGRTRRLAAGPARLPEPSHPLARPGRRRVGPSLPGGRCCPDGLVFPQVEAFGPARGSVGHQGRRNS